MIAPFQFPSDTVDEGNYGQITCSVISGDEPLQISWSLHGDVISSDPSIITTMIGTRSSILIISKVGYRHSGEYTCRATNNAGSATHSAVLRVNGNFFRDRRRVAVERWSQVVFDSNIYTLQAISLFVLRTTSYCSLSISF